MTDVPAMTDVQRLRLAYALQPQDIDPLIEAALGIVIKRQAISENHVKKLPPGAARDDQGMIAGVKRKRNSEVERNILDAIGDETLTVSEIKARVPHERNTIYRSIKYLIGDGIVMEVKCRPGGSASFRKAQPADQPAQ
jgi:hypothetical protein